MTKTQLKRWKRLSIGLVSSDTGITPARKQKLTDAINDFISCILCGNDLKEILCWDMNEGTIAVGDEMNKYLWNNQYEFERRGDIFCGKFGDQLSACVRAGFDVAVKPSGGVMGFTVGDLRKIFKNRIPGWINNYFGKRITLDISDDTEVWL